MRESSYVLWAVAFFWLFNPMSAQAVLIEVDFSSPRDGLITRDDHGGLLWLDVASTVNLSYNDVTNGVGNSWYAKLH